MRQRLPLYRLLTAALATLALTPAARAHKLEGEYRVRPCRWVRIEAWFETGDAPKGAKVRVTRADGTPLLAEPGELDEKGTFHFSYERPEALKVSVSAGQGHRADLTILAADLTPVPSGFLWVNWYRQPPAAPGAGPGAGGPAEAPSSRRRDYEFPIKDLLLGVAVLLSAAALYLAWRNGRRLDELAREVKR